MSGVTPFPNDLLDKVMPALRDSEWRVLCVVVRATLGWRAPEGGRRMRDWISHSELKRRTGRASAAVSHAIAGLVDRGLIVVEDIGGAPLVSPAARRLHGSDLFFKLSTGTVVTFSESGFRKAKTTKQRHI